MRISWRTALGFALSGVLLYFAFRGQDWGAVANALRGSNIALWILATIVSQLVFPLRAIRWLIILHPVAPNLRFGPSWRAIAIGMMLNNVALARLGEIGRALVLSREVKEIPFSSSIGSLVVDRAFDGLVILLMLALVVFDPGLPRVIDIGGVQTPLRALLLVPAIGVAIGFVFLFAAVYRPDAVQRMAGNVARRIIPRWADRVELLVRNVSTGMSVLRDGRRFFAVFAWTAVHWGVNALAFWIGFKAMNLEASFAAAVLTQGLIALAVAAPQMPGYFGAFEWTSIGALSLYAVAREDALAWAVTFHVLSFIPIVVIGGWYLARLGFKLADFRKPTTAPGSA